MTNRQFNSAIGLAVCLAALAGSPAMAQSGAQPPQTTAAADPSAAEPIGNVATLQGEATVTRDKVSAPLHVKDDIY